ncbi:MAG: hypothetical protein QXI01_06860 [Nitrososphaerota archaeon]
MRKALWRLYRCAGQLHTIHGAYISWVSTLNLLGESFRYPRQAAEIVLKCQNANFQGRESEGEACWKLEILWHGLSEAIEPLVRKKLKTDEEFKVLYEKFTEEAGYKPDATQLAKEMAYIFMNNIVFYKVL